ncbi:MAG: AIR synthase-related protein, partial [Thermomicrobium sp.]|nr:AIR synthase-related protein [Thermomicrobium sp.]
IALAAHDCSEGGLLVSLAESCIVGGVGGEFSVDRLLEANRRLDETLFGESGSRVLVQVAPGGEGAVLALAHAYGVPIIELGRTGGDRLVVADVMECELARLREAWSAGLGS